MVLGLKPEPDSDRRVRWKELLVGTDWRRGDIYCRKMFLKCVQNFRITISCIFEMVMGQKI